jgi:hypothetical protein
MNERTIKLSAIKPSSMALYFGAFGALLGLAVAILNLFRGAVAFTNATDSLLQGLLLGVSVGIFSLFIVPAIYFAIGWVLGLIDGIIINAVLQTSGGIEMGVTDIEENEMVESMPVTARPQAASATRAQPTFGEKIDRR